MYSCLSTDMNSYQPLSKNYAINPTPREALPVQSDQSCKKKGSAVGGLTYKGEKMKVKILTGALSNPRSLVMRCSEQFLFLL